MFVNPSREMGNWCPDEDSVCCSQTAWVKTLALPLSSYKSLDMSFNLSKPQFPPLSLSFLPCEKSHLKGSLWRLNV